MRKYLYLALGLSVIGCMAAQDKAPEKAPAPRTLKVKLNYTGTGTVDEKHKIIVFVFDSPDFMQGNAMPVGARLVGLLAGRHLSGPPGQYVGQGIDGSEAFFQRRPLTAWLDAAACPTTK